MKKINQLIKEIFSIIIGILIALVINNWNEERKKEEYRDQIYVSIINELEESRKEIIEKVPMQQVLVDTLLAYMNDETVPIMSIIDKVGGVNAPTIKNYSWRAIANSNIQLVAFEKILALSEIDESKENIELKLEKTIDFLFQNIKSTDPEKKEIFMLFTQDLISSEQWALREINAFLEE